MNVYDFDGTIYDGDSTVDFYLFCILHNPRVLKCLPTQFRFFVKYKAKKCTKLEFKEQFYSFLRYMDNNEQQVIAFWKKNIKKIKPWYLNQASKDDVIVSASPFFLLSPIAERLDIGKLIASDVDILTGKCLSENCYGIEKVRRIKREFGENFAIDAFYSDSMSDMPLARMSKDSFLVVGETIKKWNF